MGKLIFWFLVILFALFAARLLVRSQMTPPTEKRPAPRGKNDKRQAESMVRCAHCGIHLPRSEAILSDGQTWCSQDHARLGMKQ
ncbi:PP0621 family protein [Paracandidimonas soli]|uniref:MYND finger n=1 Tax=Paracandidimonas soli TaxID=1917182 RepID=A0A4R3UW01_9BURK|nr:PP0621 family protein [Paracandidimonas soli]TCU95170.1 uncharacterized protein EV686_10812 [Paracandidimonas soli]